MKKYLTPKPGEKFLWVRFVGVGDVLEAMADAFAVKQRFPQIEMHFLCREDFAELAASQPYIDKVITGDKNPYSALLDTAKLMQENGYSWVGSTFKGVRMAVMAYLSKIPNRLGSSKYLSFLDTANIYEWTQNCGIDLFKRSEKSLFATEENISFTKQLLATLNGKKKIFCIIGASRPDKMWPTEHWIEFLKPLAEKGWGVVLNGHGKYETDVAHKIESSVSSENILNLAGKMDLYQILAAAGQCDIVVGNDTGPMHLATLQFIPSVIISDYILPKEVGYNTPNVEFAVARQINLEAGYAKKRRKEIYAEVTPQAVREKFDELAEKFGL